MNTTLTNDLCNEVRVLRDERDAALRELEQSRKAWREVGLEFVPLAEHKRREAVLTAVLDAGFPHADTNPNCVCPQCNAWLAVRKELRGE